MIDKDEAELEHIESLLPWYATGNLGAEDVRRVERALAEVPEFRGRYDSIVEERLAAVALYESLSAPSPQALEKVFARLDSPAPREPDGKNFKSRSCLPRMFSAWRPRPLAWAVMTVGVVAIIEACLAAVIFFGAAQKGTYWTVSVVKKTAEQDGTFLMMAFVPNSTAAQISQFLEAHNAAINDGPFAGGIYRIRVSDRTLPANDLAAIVAFLRNERDIVRFVAPTT